MLIRVELHPISNVVFGGAITVHVTLTLLVYQLFFPSVPKMFEVTIGGPQTSCTALPVSFPLFVKNPWHSSTMVAGFSIRPTELLVKLLKLSIVPTLFFIVPEFVKFPVFAI